MALTTPLAGEAIGRTLDGVASLLWPLVVFAAVFLLRRELRDLVLRIRRGKFAGGEVELAPSIGTLEDKTEALEDTPLIPIDTPAPPSPDALEPAASDMRTGVEERIAEVLRVAATSPRAALMQLSADLEREGRRLLAVTGHLSKLGNSPASFRTLAQVLETLFGLNRSAFTEFADVRNAIVHATGEVPSDEILRTIDAGAVLLRRVAVVPRERNFVRHPGVPMFADSDGSVRLEGLAVILETISPGGALVGRRVFPTLRTYFLPGMEVSWEWGSQVWEEAWYEDPVSKELEYGWRQSAEFAGRDLDGL